MDEDAGLGVLRRQVVAVDGHTPALVPQQVRIAVQAANRGGQLGAEQKDVDAAEDRGLVEEICDGFLEDALSKVRNQVAVDNDSGATLCGESVTGQG